jgi:hypothetical protein
MESDEALWIVPQKKLTDGAPTVPRIDLLFLNSSSSQPSRNAIEQRRSAARSHAARVAHQKKVASRKDGSSECYRFETSQSLEARYSQPRSARANSADQARAPHESWADFGKAAPTAEGAAHDQASDQKVPVAQHRHIAIARAPVDSYLLREPAGELQIVQCYLEMQNTWTMKWDEPVFSTSISTTPDSARSLPERPKILSAKDFDATFSAVARKASLALMVAVLRHLEPVKFSEMLYIRFQQIAIRELVLRLRQQAQGIDDVLNAVSKILLASTTQGMETVSRIHLQAAFALVERKGGLKNISATTAAALIYCDFVHAISTLTPPLFPSAIERTAFLDAQLSGLDSKLYWLGSEVLLAAELSLMPPVVIGTLRDLIDAAIRAPSRLSVVGAGMLEVLTPLTAVVTGAMDDLLRSQLVVWGDGLLARRTHLCEQFSGAGDVVVLLILWCQLLLCHLSSLIAAVDIRNSLIPVCDEIFWPADGVETVFSPATVSGLQTWNRTIRQARVRSPGCVEDGDWISLVKVVETIEEFQPVQLGRFMQHAFFDSSASIDDDPPVNREQPEASCGRQSVNKCWKKLVLALGDRQKW